MFECHICYVERCETGAHTCGTCKHQVCGDCWEDWSSADMNYNAGTVTCPYCRAPQESPFSDDNEPDADTLRREVQRLSIAAREEQRNAEAERPCGGMNGRHPCSRPTGGTQFCPYHYLLANDIHVSAYDLLQHSVYMSDDDEE